MQEDYKKDIIDRLFDERCISCSGYLFLKSVEKVDEYTAKGIVSCPECEIELDSRFHFEEASH